MVPLSLRIALRRLARSSRLSLAAVLCIALGTAATSATLTLVSSTLLRPLPFPDAERLVRVWLHEPDGEERVELSYPDLDDVRRQVAGLDTLEATARARLLFQGGDGARRVECEAVSAGYFELLGVEPVVGRAFTGGEHEPGGDAVMLLSHAAWGSLFAYDGDVVGRTVRTDRGEQTVIGVMPESFTGSVEEDSGDVEFWLPMDDYLSAERRERRDVGGIWSIGRLAPGATLSAVADQAEALARRLASDWPATHRGRTLTVEPLGENWRSSLRGGSLLALGAGLLLLLVAAINVAALLFARSLDDRRGTAIRAALGARRRRMLGQVLLETTLLVGVGSLLGLAAGPPLLRAVLGQPSLVDGATLGIPVFVDLALDPLAAALSVLVFLVTAVLASVGPALVVARVDPRRTLQETGRGATADRRARRWSRGLVVAEVALTTLLVLAAALLVRSYHALESEDLGFRTDGVLRIALFVNEQDVAENTDLPRFHRALRDELLATPGVEEMGVVWPTVPIDWPIQEAITVPGMDAADTAEGGLRVGIFLADASFFDVVDLPLVAGRGLRDGDGSEAAPVAVVNRSLARRLTGGGDASRVVGLEARLGERPVRIVGVLGDARYGGPRQDETSSYQMYLPFAQSPQRLSTLMFSTSGDPATLLGPLQRRLATLAPSSALDWSGPLDRWVRDLYLLDSRFLLSFVGLFSAACLVLAAIGLFAQLAHAVARRRREMGIRQALGASPGRIQGMVVGEGLRPVILGLAVGTFGGWLAADVLGSFVWGIPTADPWSFAATVLVLLAVAVTASLPAARRAAATAPAEVLRDG
ncbi:MAG TPA: ABC transporter permease [Thermoanaerobaculia bacterium]|nr:ABC transporter permease [Thermoanaerobaculia bacterium]